MIVRILLLLLMGSTAARAQVALVADSLSGLPGSQLDAQIRVVQWQNILSCQGTIEWDPQVVQLDTVYQFGLPGMNVSNFGQALVGSGKLTFSWNEPNLQGSTLADSSTAFTLGFSLVGSAGTSSPLSFTSDPTTLEFVDGNFTALPFNVIAGEIAIEDTNMVGMDLAPLSHSEWGIFPHPVQAESIIRWQGRGEPVSWTLWTADGKQWGGGTVEQSQQFQVNQAPIGNQMQLGNQGQLGHQGQRDNQGHTGNQVQMGNQGQAEYQGWNQLSWSTLIPAELPRGIYYLNWEVGGKKRRFKVLSEGTK